MQGISGPELISTRQEKIATLARQAPEMGLTSLNYYLDFHWLHEAYRRTRKDGATGIDGQTAAAYAANLETNLRDLLERAKSGRYRAPAVRRVHIPKGDGSKTRPIGIPTFEDKILQRAVVMLLEPLYEQDFLPCSYGFRPGRSQHQALQALWDQTMAIGGGLFIEIDIKSFFDALDKAQLREILERRVRDGVVLRLIGKWLNAGVLEGGAISYSDTGTPQGGVISPLLANVYLHAVLDHWFEQDVKPRLKGKAFLIRFADDAVLGFARDDDASRMMVVLPKRFAKFGLTLHPEKTRMVNFHRPKNPKPPSGAGGSGPGTFDLLGFTHYWGKSRRGYWVVQRKTANDRFSRAVRRIADWCRTNRHLPLAEQQQALGQKLRGHYGYYGITGNSRALQRFLEETKRRWRKWLGRRAQRTHRSWDWFVRLLERYPLPMPKIVHSSLRRAANQG